MKSLQAFVEDAIAAFVETTQQACGDVLRSRVWQALNHLHKDEHAHLERHLNEIPRAYNKLCNLVFAVNPEAYTDGVWNSEHADQHVLEFCGAVSDLLVDTEVTARAPAAEGEDDAYLDIPEGFADYNSGDEDDYCSNVWVSDGESEDNGVIEGEDEGELEGENTGDDYGVTDYSLPDNIPKPHWS